MSTIPTQLAAAGSSLANATHIVPTTGDNDLGVSESITQIVLKNNYTTVANKAINTVRPGTKIYALSYVDFISVGNKILNEDDAHRLMDVLSNTIKAAAEEVKTAFLGHGMYLNDPYSGSLSGSVLPIQT